MPRERYVRLTYTGTHYRRPLVCALVLEHGRVVKASPQLAGLVGKCLRDVRRYAATRSWQIEIIRSVS